MCKCAGHSCGCRMPFPWAKVKPAPAPQVVNPILRCPIGTQRTVFMQRNRRVAKCIAIRRVSPYGTVHTIAGMHFALPATGSPANPGT
jgi:hypothetical protein